MLHNENRVHHAPLPRGTKTLTIAILAVAGLIVAGLRGPDGGALSSLQAQEAPRSTRGAINLSYVPSETGLMIAIRPADLLALPEFKPVGELFEQRFDLGGELLRVSPLEIEQVLLFWRRDPVVRPDAPAPGQGSLAGKVSGVIMRTTKVQDWKRATAGIVGDPEGPYKGKATSVPRRGRRLVLLRPTIGRPGRAGGGGQTLIDAGPDAAVRHPRMSR